MKYVILKLLRDKPRHGYEVMKELEERMHGCYSPSPGTVYPTLQWLEDEGLVVAKDVDGKKVYEITDQGKQFLEEHKDVVEDIFDRVKDAVDQALGGSMAELNQAVGRLVKQVYRIGWKTRDEAVREKITEILKRAARRDVPRGAQSPDRRSAGRARARGARQDAGARGVRRPRFRRRARYRVHGVLGTALLLAVGAARDLRLGSALAPPLARRKVAWPTPGLGGLVTTAVGPAALAAPGSRTPASSACATTARNRCCRAAWTAGTPPRPLRRSRRPRVSIL